MWLWPVIQYMHLHLLEFSMHAKPYGRKVSSDTLKKLAKQFTELAAIQHKAIAARLRMAIVDGTLQPDDILTQQSIADAFGVSRMPVREALRTLEAQGYLQSVRYKAYAVTAASTDTWPGDLPGLLRAVTEQYVAHGNENAQLVFGHQVMEFLASLKSVQGSALPPI
jgi:DNA-binding GntR family transcriptional regulator